VLKPVPVEVLGRDPKLDNQVVGQVLGFGLATLVAPETSERRLVVAHDDPSVGAAYKETS
jgi:hypothetical protein